MDYLDFYAVKYDLNVMSKSSYKSWFGFVSSILTLVILVFTGLLIGSDFLFKSNPNVIQSTKMPEESEPVYINNQNFTIAFKLRDEGEISIPESKAVAFPYFGYYHYKKKNGNLEVAFAKFYNPVPCTQTEAKDNPLLSGYNVETLLCFDLNQIKADLAKAGIETEKDISLYGGWDEDSASLFWLGYGNCKYTDEMKEDYCISYEESAKRNYFDQYVTVYVPRMVFDPEDYEEPVSTYYDSISYLMSPFTSFQYNVRFALNKLNDDRGWIFEDITEVVRPNIHSEQKAYRFLQKEAFEYKNAFLFNYSFTFTRQQVHYKRVYIKIQELAANMGGMIKLVMLVFGMANKFYATWRIESHLVNKYFIPKADQPRKEDSSVAIPVRKNKDTGRVNISFLEYISLKFWCGSKLKAKKEALKAIKAQLDIENILVLGNSIKEIKNPENRALPERLIKFGTKN